MAEENVLSGTQAGVVDPKPSDALAAGEAAENKSGSVEQENKSAEVTPKPQQSKQENDKFAQLRREKEAARAEAAALKAEIEKYKASAKKEGYGASSNNPRETKQADLSEKGGEDEHASESEKSENNQLEEIIKSHPRLQELENKVKSYEKELQKAQFSKDLAEIKSKFPDETAESVLDLGEEYIRLRAAGISNLVAYGAIMQTRERAEIKPEEAPKPESGAVGNAGESEKEILTESELDKLSKSELLGNPSLLEKAIKSLTRLKKQI